MHRYVSRDEIVCELLREQGRTYFALDEFVSEASPSTCSLEHQPHFLGNDYRIAKPGHHSSGSKLDNLPDIRPLHNNTFLTSSSIINAISIYTYSYSTSASVGHALRLTSEDNFFEVDDAWTRFRIMQTLKSPTGLSSLESSRSLPARRAYLLYTRLVTPDVNTHRQGRRYYRPTLC